MPIEIKQMVIKSNVIQAYGRDDDADGNVLPEAQRKELLDECKRLIQEALREAKER
jgi:hypothetical protein